MTYSIKRGATLPVLRATLTQTENEVTKTVDLSTVVSVKFAFRLLTTPANLSRVVDCVVIDAPGGVVQYAWVPGDTDRAGQYEGEFHLTYQSGEVLKLPTQGKIPFLIDNSVRTA